MPASTVVLKFDGAMWRRQEFLPSAVQEVHRWYRAGWRVLAVSTLGSNKVATERHGARLLLTILDGAGIPARLVDPLEIGLAASGGVPDLGPTDLDRGRLATLLHECPVIVLPGSFGCDTAGRVQLFGRGGADLTATFLAGALQTRCVVDPVEAPPEGDSQWRPPASVLLLGLGAIGLGVYRRLLAQPAHFRVVGALVRDREKHIANGIPEELLHGPGDDLSGVPTDIVVDTLPLADPSRSLAAAFLSRGASFVSSNKSLIAAAGPALTELAACNGAELLYSAAVGGSAPMIETLRREAQRGEILSIAAILNTPSSHVLDRCVEGLLLNEAKRAAHERGLAAEEPAEDLCGHDVACKLHILARHAFGQDLSGIAVEPVSTAAILRCRSSLDGRATLRYVARAWKLGDKVLGQVRLEAIAADSPLAMTRADWNRLVITRASGESVVVNGRGASRRAATVAMMADLLDLRRAAIGRGRSEPHASECDVHLEPAAAPGPIKRHDSLADRDTTCVLEFPASSARH